MSEAALPVLLIPAGIIDPGAGLSTEGHALLVDKGRIDGLVPKGEVDSVDAAVERHVCPDAWVMPGLVNLHEYLSVDPDRADPMGRMFSEDLPGRAWCAARSLAKDLASGVTTMRVMGEGHAFDSRVATAIASGEIAGPGLVTSGVPITPTHGHQRGPQGFDGPDEIRRAVRRNVRDGAAWIKLVLTGGVNAHGLGPRDLAYDRSEVRAAVEEAHRAGRRVAAAAHGGAAVHMAVEEGVATIEHGSLFDNADIAAVAGRDVTVVLTLSRFFHPSGIRKSASAAPHILAACDRACQAMRRAVPAMLAAGVRLGIGTDNMHGFISHDIRYFVELGAAPAVALAAATRTGALALGQDDSGGLAAGHRADFVVLAGNPLCDLSVLERPEQVYRGGLLRVGRGSLAGVTAGWPPT